MSLSDEEDLECPLCMEEIDITDKYFRPCPCGYQICRFCWNHIKENLSGLCPACRRPYLEENVEFKPVSAEELAKVKNAKKRKEREKKEQDMAARKQLANVRVVQKNLVYVLGLPPKLASEEILKSYDYFGQYGKIIKVVVNRKTSASSGSGNIGIYITYSKKEDAAKAIEAVDGSIYEGRVVRATFGTTKYCSYFLKGQTCQNVGCQFLHEPGEETDTFVKDDLGPQSGREKTGKPAAFPIGKKEDVGEPTLPVTANWAKPASQPQIALNNPKQFPSLAHAASGEISTSSNSTSNAKEVSPDRFGQNLSSVNTNNDSSQANPARPQMVKKDVPPVPVSMKVLCFDFPGNIKGPFGHGLVPQYNGMFDPFQEAGVLNIQALLHLRSVNTLSISSAASSITTKPPASSQKQSAPSNGKPASATIGMEPKGNSSRFERLFDDGSRVPQDRANQAQESLRAIFPNSNISFTGTTDIQESRWNEGASPNRMLSTNRGLNSQIGGTWSGTPPNGMAPYHNNNNQASLNMQSAGVLRNTPANFQFLTPQQQQQYVAYMQQQMTGATAPVSSNVIPNGWA